MFAGMQATEYFIINTTDAPNERHVTEMRPSLGRGKKRGLYYIHASLSGRKEFHGMKTSRPTSLADFGFDVEMSGLRLLMFRQVRESIATYADGKPRRWQGKENFSFYRRAS